MKIPDSSGHKSFNLYTYVPEADTFVKVSKYAYTGNGMELNADKSIHLIVWNGYDNDGCKLENYIMCPKSLNSVLEAYNTPDGRLQQGLLKKAGSSKYYTDLHTVAGDAALNLCETTRVIVY